MEEDIDQKGLQARFRKPDNFVMGNYQNADGRTIRYGFIQSACERAVAIHQNAQACFIEMEFESAVELAAAGVSTWYLERVGDGGSERLYADPQKPPAIAHETYVRDMHHFITQVVSLPKDTIPVIALGNCLGCLVIMRYLQEHGSFFDHCILTSPMFGQGDKPNRDKKCAAMEITPQNETKYIGKTGDWTWEAAKEIIKQNDITHDYERRCVPHLYRRDYPALRMGGFTYGNVIQTMRSLVALMEPGVLEAINTPVTIVSPERDINNTARHFEVAARMPYANYVHIKDGLYALWREADPWRQQVFATVAGVVHSLQKRTSSSQPVAETRPDIISWNSGVEASLVSSGTMPCPNG